MLCMFKEFISIVKIDITKQENSENVIDVKCVIKMFVIIVVKIVYKYIYNNYYKHIVIRKTK